MTHLLPASRAGINKFDLKQDFDRASGKHYATMGVADLAEFLLREYAAPKAHSDLAIATSIFAIKKVKDNNKFCGGECRQKKRRDLESKLLEMARLLHCKCE